MEQHFSKSKFHQKKSFRNLQSLQKLLFHEKMEFFNEVEQQMKKQFSKQNFEFFMDYVFPISLGKNHHHCNNKKSISKLHIKTQSNDINPLQLINPNIFMNITKPAKNLYNQKTNTSQHYTIPNTPSNKKKKILFKSKTLRDFDIKMQIKYNSEIQNKLHKVDPIFFKHSKNVEWETDFKRKKKMVKVRTEPNADNSSFIPNDFLKTLKANKVFLNPKMKRFCQTQGSPRNQKSQYPLHQTFY